MTDIFTYLQNNSYPGRGIICGSYYGDVVIAYFIMGRSENSRNRIFVKKDDVLFTKAFDESKVADPSLIIYNCIREYDGNIIVTNGDQTDTIYDHLKQGKTFADGLNTREYEPDAPNYTPRISALMNTDSSYEMAILKKDGEECERIFYHYKREDNVAHFISTYDKDGDPLPSFSSEPIRFVINKEFNDFANELWNSLDPDNKVSLYVRFDDEEIIFNRNEEER